ncbi:hypothetical protein GPECTOR_136g637 [Gonium pectorale]|uniref:Uncharacterized protein n=1 Tax=Gonium pectorale TaxID=33097 RepID=A0A150FY58_GONPE|nr:hypothetical protein GPECTOR_136g637 [Gonium pectorale]|eukprot:KXZ42554.1 hypothetical protein GPECTOR_136g637 [Gonium pectorale]
MEFVDTSRALARPAAAAQKDVTAQLLERAFALALQVRMKQYGTIDVDVRSTAWGLMEGKFGGLTVRGQRWRTPLELTATELMVDVGELVLDYQKFMWQQTVALKNVPQGSVSFTLTSQDLANFMVHPIMAQAASRAVQGKAFVFDRSTAAVRIDPATGRGVITYQGVWAGDGQRYDVSMSTPPTPAKAVGAVGNGRPATAGALAAPSNTMEQLTVSARRLGPPPASRSGTGSYASMGSRDERPGPAAQGSAAGAVARATPQVAVAVAAPAAGLSTASAGSQDEDVDPGAEVVAEGLRRFFSSLVLNLQGVELRQPTLLVTLPGPGQAAAAGAVAAPRGPAAPAPGSPSGPATLPALLTIIMKVAIVQLPPLNMKF